ncbi:hypothetical protein BOC40_29175 [Burkholderia pseudomallei]|nr:hypothetical protein BOC40_29175 [Burkholderia pseudomallei]ARL42406.1 hypothetical protein BOC50_03740 [Burkholderia pseudomallei]
MSSQYFGRRQAIFILIPSCRCHRSGVRIRCFFYGGSISASGEGRIVFSVDCKTIDAKWQIDHIARHAHPRPMPDPAGQGAILCRHDLEFDLESKLFQCKTM